MYAEGTITRYGYEVSKEDVYKDYLTREVIPFEEKIITEDYIRVTIPSTLFTDRRNKSTITEKEFMEVLKEVRKLAKEKGVKVVGINKVAKNMKDSYHSYEKEAILYQDKFEQLCKGWKNHEIRSGYSDDFYYEEVLQRLEFELRKMTNRNTQLSRFENLFNRCKEVISDLQNKKDVVLITLY